MIHSKCLRTWPAAALLLTAALASAGCEGFAFLAALGGETVPAMYELQDRPTLIMVEDPHNALGDASLNRLIASHADHHLRDHEVLSEPAVPQGELAALAERLGDAYARTPIDEVGQALEAEQVIHVLIDSVSLQAAPGVYRPTVTAEVRVIDAVESRRLFPASRRVEDPDSRPPGHPIRTQLTYRTDETEARALEVSLKRALAERLGEDVAQVFYKHKRALSGEQLR